MTDMLSKLFDIVGCSHQKSGVYFWLISEYELSKKTMGATKGGAGRGIRNNSGKTVVNSRKTEYRPWEA